MKHWMVWLVWAAVGLSLGCTSSQAAPEVAWREGALNDGGPTALVSGMLQLNDGCLYLTAEDGTDYLPVFRGAPSWGDHGALETEHGTFELGRPVELTGGESAASAEVSDDTHIPKGCDLTKPRWTVN
ncbi:hypothetical protein [Tessaracoccus sp. Z1128]